MKLKQLMAMMAAVTLTGAVAFGQSTQTNITFNVNQAIPDGDLSGMALSTNLTLPTLAGSISAVTVSLNISGGWNGDLYGYLVRPGGQGFSVLFNRVGASNNATAFGYGDSGFNVTFSDSSSDNFHYYQNVGGYSLSGSTWAPDGRNLDPTGDPNLFGSTSPSTFLSSFNGYDPNGVWTLFLADLSAGDQATLVSWSLDITSVPEPSTMALTGVGLAGMMLLIRRRTRS